MLSTRPVDVLSKCEWAGFETRAHAELQSHGGDLRKHRQNEKTATWTLL